MVAFGAFIFGLLDPFIWNAPALTVSLGLYVSLFVAAWPPGVVLETGLMSRLQIAGPEAARGRVFGALTLVTNAGQAAGMLAAGVLTAPAGLMVLLNLQGCPYLLAGTLAVGALARPALLDRHVAASPGG
jgi:hypothetical protein